MAVNEIEALLEHWTKLHNERKEHGEYVPPVYACAKCKDSGYLYRTDEEGYTRQCDCECSIKRLAQEKTQRIIESSGLGDKFHQCTFDTYKTTAPWQEKIFDIAQKYVNESTSEWFFIGGQSGSGKTHICTAILGEFVKSRKVVRYFRWRDEGARLKRYANDPQVYEEEITSFKSCDVLYIDDFFKGRNVTDGDINLAFELLNYRYDKHLKTLISTEITTDKLNTIDNAIAGRIIESCGEYLLNLETSDEYNIRIK